MANKNFELFGGNFGNGTVLYNKAVTEGGDFKKIGRITPAGRILFLNPKNYAGEEIPDDAMKKICEWSIAAEKAFKAQWYKLPDLNRYEIMLDAIPAADLLDLESPIRETLKACTDLREKVVLLEQIYFKNYA